MTETGTFVQSQMRRGQEPLYTYDAMDRLRVCMGGTDLCTYERDHAGNILPRQMPLDGALYYGYDLLGGAVLKKDETDMRRVTAIPRQENGRRSCMVTDAGTVPL